MTFINMVLERINPKQIVSLHLNTIRLSPEITLPSLISFPNVISLTLFDPLYVQQIIEYAEYFPKLTYLSLWYKHQVSITTLCDILRQVQRPIKRLELHCTGISCGHYFKQPSAENCSIEYFLLDVRHFELSATNKCFQDKELCFLLTLINFMKYLHNIRRVRVIINQDNLNQVLVSNEWNNLINNCHYLKKVTVETLQTILSDGQIVQKVMEIQKGMVNT
jgi:hypothetical protein